MVRMFGLCDFNSWQKTNIRTQSSVTNRYNLTLAKWQWCYVAGEITTPPAWWKVMNTSTCVEFVFHSCQEQNCCALHTDRLALMTQMLTISKQLLFTWELQICLRYTVAHQGPHCSGLIGYGIKNTCTESLARVRYANKFKATVIHNKTVYSDDSDDILEQNQKIR